MENVAFTINHLLLLLRYYVSHIANSNQSDSGLPHIRWVLCRLLTSYSPWDIIADILAQTKQRIRSPAVRYGSFIRSDWIYSYTLLFEHRLFYIMLGYPAIKAYYPVSVRPNLILPSASFSHYLTVITLPRLMN